MGCVWVLREVGEWKFVLCLWFHFGGRVGWGCGDEVGLFVGHGYCVFFRSYYVCLLTSRF